MDTGFLKGERKVFGKGAKTHSLGKRGHLDGLRNGASSPSLRLFRLMPIYGGVPMDIERFFLPIRLGFLFFFATRNKFLQRKGKVLDWPAGKRFRIGYMIAAIFSKGSGRCFELFPVMGGIARRSEFQEANVIPKDETLSGENLAISQALLAGKDSKKNLDLRRASMAITWFSLG